MLETWILSKIEPLKSSPLIIMRDPQRMIQRGAHVVDGWAVENEYTVLFCTGNLGLRDLYEPLRDTGDVRILVVDRSRKGASGELFYPDLEARLAGASGNRRTGMANGLLELSLREFLVEQTGDKAWPHLVEERNLSRLILANIPGILEAHSHLRRVNESRFSDSDFYRILLGAVLKINPFSKPGASDIRRLCIEQHNAIDEISQILPPEVMESLRTMVAGAPKPFCWLLERDPELILRAFTLAAMMRQHHLDYTLLLANLDPALHEFRDIDVKFLDAAIQDQWSADPERVSDDVRAVELFLSEEPKRLAFLLRDHLQIDKPEKAFEVIKNERLSLLVRSLALSSLLVDLIATRNLKFHRQVLEVIQAQELETNLPALRRPTEQWGALVNAYRRAIDLYTLTAILAKAAREFKIKADDGLGFEDFDQLWNKERLNRLDFYVSDLERILRVNDLLPVPHAVLWPEFENRWNAARQEFKETASSVDAALGLVNRRFQDLYRLHYSDWIQQADAPVIFTHQFLPRLLKAHWDPKSGQKAVVLVFDGMRTDAWDEFLRPVLEERFDLIEVRPGSAILPTETELSRKALSAGCLPAEFPIKSRRELDLLREWLKNELQFMPAFQVIKDEDTDASGMTVRYSSPQLEYVVFNFTDENLHGNQHELAFIYQSIVREIIRQDVRALLRELPDDCLIFVTSDHGFTTFPSEPIDIPESVVADEKMVKYRVTRASNLLSNEDGKKVVTFEIKKLKIPIPDAPRTGQPVRFVHFTRPGYIFLRERFRHHPDKYGHGGLSLAECLIPMVVLGPRKKDQGVMRIDDLRQVGSVTEGEALEVEVIIRAYPLVMQDLAISLAFNLSELPAPRKEIFSGAEKTYRQAWQPLLPEITAEQREAGEMSIPVTVILTYQQDGKAYRASRTTDVRIKLDTTRLRRRLDSKLDLLMGKVPKELKS